MVDFIIERAKIETKTVAPDELMKEADEDGDEPMTSAGVPEEEATS